MASRPRARASPRSKSTGRNVRRSDWLLEGPGWWRSWTRFEKDTPLEDWGCDEWTPQLNNQHPRDRELQYIVSLSCPIFSPSLYLLNSVWAVELTSRRLREKVELKNNWNNSIEFVRFLNENLPFQHDERKPKGVSSYSSSWLWSGFLVVSCHRLDAPVEGKC